MKNKTIWILAAAVAALCVAAVLFLRLRGSREADLLALLPPETEVYGSIDVRALAGNSAMKELLAASPGLPKDADYEKFVQATGFRWESDLDRIAIARLGPDWIGAARANLHRATIVHYLESIGAVKSEVLGKTVYSSGQVRLFRLAFLDDLESGALIAFTAGGDALRIRQAIKRGNRTLKDSAASEYFGARDGNRIPAGSQIWFIGKPEAFLGQGGGAQIGSFGLAGGFLRGSSRIFLSLAGSVSGAALQIEDECTDAAAAERIAQTVGGILSLLKAPPSGKNPQTTASTNGKDPEPDPSELLASLSIEQKDRSVFLKWRLDDKRMQMLVKLLR